MRKYTFNLFIGFLFIGLSSCGTNLNKQYSSSPNIDIAEPSIRVSPLIADLKVEEKKIKGSSTMGFGKGMPAPIEACKLSAIGNALLAAKADVLVEPFYTVNVSNNTVTVNVEGYPGFYKSFNKK